MTNIAVTASSSTASRQVREFAPELNRAPHPPLPAPRFRVRLASAGPALWRVVSSSGHVIGHLHHVEHDLGSRWQARRYLFGRGGFHTLGEFWSVDDAVGALSAG